jgi:hypothetical protein
VGHGQVKEVVALGGVMRVGCGKEVVALGGGGN